MKTTMKVHKFDCASCAMVMEGICEDTPGVQKAEVNARTKVLTVEHDPSVQLDTLIKSLDAEGYPVEVIQE